MMPPLSHVVAFDEATHTYRDTGGVIQPSVTTVLHAVGLVNGDRYTDEARDRGTLIHKLARVHLETIAGGAPGKALGMLAVAGERGVHGYLSGFVNYINERQLTPLAIERPMRDPLLCYAGTPDLIAKDRRGAVGVLDIKSGSIERWHKVQVEAYARLASHAHGPITWRVILYVRANGTARAVTVPPADWVTADQVWLAALRVYRTRQLWARTDEEWRRANADDV